MGTHKGHAVGLGKEAKLRQHGRHPAGLLDYLSCLPSEIPEWGWSPSDPGQSKLRKSLRMIS